MNTERQKTDAIADAVEIPEGATHYNEKTESYFCLEDGLWSKLVNGSWWHTSRPCFNGLIEL